MGNDVAAEDGAGVGGRVGGAPYTVSGGIYIYIWGGGSYETA